MDQDQLLGLPERDPGLRLFGDDRAGADHRDPITASYVYLKGLEVKGVPQILTTHTSRGAISDTGSNNVYELIRHAPPHGPRALRCQGGMGTRLNCDRITTHDPKSSTGPGTNADGFGCHIDGGQTGNVFRGCRAWYNTDDGYDSSQSFGSGHHRKLVGLAQRAICRR